MSKAITADVRRAAVEAARQGLQPAEVAIRYGVSRSSVLRWIRKVETTGRLTPEPRGGDRRSGQTNVATPRIVELCQLYPDITVDDLHARLTSEGARISVSTVRRVLRRKGMQRRWLARRDYYLAQTA